MNKIKVAVIGTGNMGIHHIRNYLNTPLVEFIAAVDRDEKRLQFISEKFAIPTYSSIDEIIDQVDAVSIATPTSSHYQIAAYCMNRGKHVLLEKPITLGIAEGEKLIALSKHNEVVFAVGHVERFNPVIHELLNVLADQKPVYIDIHRESPFDPRIFDVDVVSDLMIHDIDLLMYVLNENIKLKSAFGIRVHSDNCDIVNAQFISESGILLNVTTSRATEQKVRQWRLILPKSLIEVDLAERKLLIYRRTSVTIEMMNDRDVKYKQDQVIEKVVVPNYEPLQMEISDFLQSIIERKPPKVGGEEGLNALKLVIEIQRLIDQQERES